MKQELFIKVVNKCEKYSKPRQSAQIMTTQATTMPTLVTEGENKETEYEDGNGQENEIVKTLKRSLEKAK